VNKRFDLFAPAVLSADLRSASLIEAETISVYLKH